PASAAPCLRRSRLAGAGRRGLPGGARRAQRAARRQARRPRRGRPGLPGHRAVMRILHAPSNIAGIAGLLARAERDLGYDATAVEYVSRRLAFQTDRSLHLEARHGPLAKGAAVGGFALEALRAYDVFHFYFGNTLFPWPWPDLPLLRAVGKRSLY